jgi:hypothetical protein
MTPPVEALMGHKLPAGIHKSALNQFVAHKRECHPPIFVPSRSAKKTLPAIP